MKRWLYSLILLLVLFGVVAYVFVPRLTDRLNVDVMWNANKKRSSGLTPQEQGAAREILDLRQRHHLRPLTNAESGARTRDLAYGIYGFAACDAQTLNAARTKDPVLEVHKHRDGIAYYVGYASEEQIEKYLTRQKNFHILASPEPREKASLLFEIPVDFVSTCAVRTVGNGVGFDLFVTAIPELHTFHRSLERPG
jgi:hypothetical protein